MLLIVLITVYLCLHIISVLFQFIVSFHMLTHYMHVHFLFFLHTHFVASDDPEFARLDTGYFMLLIRGSMRLDMLRGAGVSLYLFWYYCLPFHSC